MVIKIVRQTLAIEGLWVRVSGRRGAGVQTPHRPSVAVEARAHKARTAHAAAAGTDKGFCSNYTKY